MKKDELKKLEQEAKAKGKALSKAYKSNPKAKGAKDTTPTCRVLSATIDKCIKAVEQNVERLVGDMKPMEALQFIETLQQIRETEHFAELKWGK